MCDVTLVLVPSTVSLVLFTLFILCFHQLHSLTHSSLLTHQLSPTVPLTALTADQYCHLFQFYIHYISISSHVP